MSELIFRQATLDATRGQGTQRAVEASLSSEFPVDRSFGPEVLEHSENAIDLSRAPLPLLTSHDHDAMPVGVVEGLRVIGRKLRGTLRFSERAADLWSDVQSGILRNISIGYRIIDGQEDADGVFHATRWQPLEVSLVSVPADPSVGIGRSYQQGEDKMTTEIENETPATSRSERRAIEQATQDERGRIARIQTLAKITGQRSPSESFTKALDAMAASMIRDGRSVEVFERWITDNEPPEGVATNQYAGLPKVGMSSTEVENYSFLRAIRAQVDPNFARRGAGLELEASRAMAQQLGKEPQGIYVPSEVLSRDLNVGTATAGGNLVANNLLAADFITLLRNQMVVFRAGARSMSGLVGNISIPRQTAGNTSYWVAEGVAPTESQGAFDQITMTPKTVGGFTDITRKLLLQSTPDAENLVRMDLAATVAQAIDLAALNGSGVGAEPLGILNVTGIGDVAGGTNGAAPTWDHIVDLESAVAVENADQGTLGYVTNSVVRGKLKKTFVDASSNAERVWDTRAGNRPLNGYAGHVTNQIPSDLDKGTSTGVCSAIVFGNWSDLIIGAWSVLDLLVDPYTHSTTGAVRVVGLQDVDVAVRHPESFAAMLDVLTS